MTEPNPGQSPPGLNIPAPSQPTPSANQPLPQYQQASAPGPETAYEEDHPEVILISHSPLVYWWPVWVVGYLMAGLTWWYGDPHTIGDTTVKFHHESSIGVLFFLTLFLVIIISNVNVRGYASGMVLLTIITISVVLAYFNLWGGILGWVGDLNIYLNQGAYFWFSTLMFIVWATTVFVIDRFKYWRITPGQVTQVVVFGAGSKSYDTENLVLEKRRDDLFRHWLLGLGSGDLRITTFGAKSQELFVPNVLFIGSKIHAVQHMIAREPGKFGHTAIE